MVMPDAPVPEPMAMLNAEQFRAVHAPPVPLLVQRGAGCGKTEQMVRRADPPAQPARPPGRASLLAPPAATSPGPVARRGNLLRAHLLRRVPGRGASPMAPPAAACRRAPEPLGRRRSAAGHLRLARG